MPHTANMSTARGPGRKKSPEDQVTDELLAVARHTLEDVFRPGGERPDVPLLTDLARRHFQDKWPDDATVGIEEAADAARAKSQVLADMLRIAANRLEGQFGRITNQEAALRLFNLDGGLSRPDITPVVLYGLENKKYSEIYQSLLQRAGYKKQFDRPSDKVRLLRQRLSAVLTDPAFPFMSVETVGSSGVLVVRSSPADEYVPRPDYEQHIRQLRDAGEPCVWLWGEAGTGKTRMARAANRDRVTERAVPILTASDEQTFNEQLTDLVVKPGKNAAEINATNVKASFIAELGKERLPKVIVFEDMSPRDTFLKRLIAAQGSFLVFTSNKRPETGREAYDGPLLQVQDMTALESTQMIRSRLPHIGDDDVHLLNTTLAGRPLAIEHSCSYLRKTGMAIVVYCASIAREPARTLDAAGRSHTKTLTKMYDLILEYLSDSSDSVRALDDILFTWPSLLTADMLSFLWVDNLYPRSPDDISVMLRTMSPYLVSLLDSGRWPGVTARAVSQVPYFDPTKAVQLGTALSELADLGLIRYEDNRIVMHQLTRSILQALRRNLAAAVYDRVMNTAHALLVDDKWRPGEPLQGHLIPWIPHVTLAVAQLDVDASGVPANLSQTDVKKLALLGAMVIRGHIQMGLSTNSAMESVKKLYAVVATRTLYVADSPEERDDLMTDFFGLYKEMATVITLSAGFSRELDGTLLLNDVMPVQERIANGIRLTYDTEWELSYTFASFQDKGQFPPKEQAETTNGGGVSRLKESASHAMLLSRFYYDQCRWRDAIAALEHAYACYIEVGGDTEAIRGAIDAARRLARARLRAGPAISTSYLNEASEWLGKAKEVKLRRSDAILNGHRSRYRLHDVLLDTQLQQTMTQLELTRQLLVWDATDAESDLPSVDDFKQFVSEPYQRADGQTSNYSRLDEARQALGLLSRIRAKRLVPEFRMHLVRLCSLAQDPRTQEHLGNLQSWFSNENLTYQTDLLNVQQLASSAFGIASMFLSDEPDFLAQTEQFPDSVRDEIKATRSNPTVVSDNYYAAAYAMRKHNNPYWYARGLAATLIIGLVTEREKSWVDGVRAELRPAAASIGRTDWIDTAENYGYTNSGLWLFGY